MFASAVECNDAVIVQLTTRTATALVGAECVVHAARRQMQRRRRRVARDTHRRCHRQRGVHVAYTARDAHRCDHRQRGVPDGHAALCSPEPCTARRCGLRMTVSP